MALFFATVGCGGARSPIASGAAKGAGAFSATTAAVVASNILRQDYAGSAACGACHGEVVAAWNRSPMHRMTRLPAGTEIRAPFDGREFRFKGDVARFEQVNGARFVRLSPRDGPPRIYRVTKVIGGRYREDFAGVEVASTALSAAVTGDAHAELLLPVSYVFQNASFRLKGYSVMVGERPGLRAGGVWNQTCIFCHNTIPYFDDLWGALYGAGAPSYQGEVVDRLLPRARRVGYSVTDMAGLGRAIDDEVAVLTAATRAGGAAAAAGTTSSFGADDARLALGRAIGTARSRFGPEHFLEIGIGCESCHGGSREHVDDPRIHPTFQPRAAFLTIDAPPGANTPISSAEWQNRACARCHQVLFSRYPRTWEGGSRRGPADAAGGSQITSGEARDFLLGSCARAMTCTTCHDPHGEDRRDDMGRLATPARNGVCTGCHPSLATPEAVKIHARHEPGGAGGACVACHMPRKNMGLGYALTRYHRIGSPTDPLRVERDRPMECALCHADKTVGTLLADIARLWGKHYDQSAILRLYGSLDANALVATIERGYAHEQAAAMGAAGEQRFQPAAAAIAQQIDRNPYPLVRYYAAAAAAAIAGKVVPANLGSEPGDGDHGTVPASSAERADDED